MEFAYCRVSTKDQNLARQVEAMRQLGIPERNIYTDKVSGKTFDRPAYNVLVGQILREGDLLTIYSIDRLGRDYSEIIKQWEHITKTLKADIRVIDMPLLDTRGADGRNIDKTFISDLVLQILSYVAEKERINIHARQEAGINAMQVSETLLTKDGRRKKIGKNGVATGRPVAQYPENWDSVYAKWKQGNITATEAMNTMGLKRNTFYNLAKKFETQ